MSEMLYRKKANGRYEPAFNLEPAGDIVPEPVLYYNLTNEQALTAAGALGVTLMALIEKHVPPHKLVARKIKAVEDAILNLYKGTGQEIDDEVADAMCRAWDKAMQLISAEEGI